MNIKKPFDASASSVPHPEEASGELNELPGLTSSAAAAHAVTPPTEPSEPLQVEAPVRRRRFRPQLRPLDMHVRVRTFNSFRFRDYRLLWGATFFAMGGSWLQQVIVGWLIYDLTRSAFLTSLAVGLELLPILLVGPFGGLLADSWDRRKLLVSIFGYQALLVLGLASIMFMGRAESWHIFAFIMLVGLSWPIADPARVALIANIVPRENLVNAFALSSLSFSVARLTAPAIGGLLLALAGAGPALVLEAIMLMAAVVMSAGLRVRPSSRPSLRASSAFPRILEAVRYVKGQPVILKLLLFGIVPSVLVMPFVLGLMPVYASEVFKVGPTGLGLMLSALGVGGVVGTLVMASLGDVHGKGKLFPIATVVIGVAMGLFAINPVYWLALPVLVLLTTGMAMFFTATVATIQGMVSDEYRGRVMGLYMVSWGLFPVGSLLAGALADRFGAPAATLVGWGILATLVAGLSLRVRSIWRFQ